MAYPRLDVVGATPHQPSPNDPDAPQGFKRERTIDDLHADIGHLAQLLEAIYDTLGEMDYGTGETRNKPLDRVASLSQIAIQMAHQADADIHYNHQRMGAGR